MARKYVGTLGSSDTDLVTKGQVVGKGDLVVIDTDHASLAAALTATPTGGTLEVRGTYTLGTPFVINKACTVRWARGASITASADGVSVTASGVVLERPKVIGAGSGTAGTQSLIKAVGTAGAPIDDLTIINPRLSASAKHGIYLEHVTDFLVDQPAIQNVAYGGIMVLSGINGEIRGGFVRNVTQPSGFVNSYGIAITRSSSQSLAVSPRSAHVKVHHVRIDGVTQWEGLDTHGGDSLDFSHNIITNCWIGIACVPCPNESSVETYAPVNMRIVGNRIDGQRTDGLARAAIQLIGCSTDNGDGTWTVVEYASGVIQGNMVERHGTAASTHGAGINAWVTRNTSVVGNSIKEVGLAGISTNHDNEGLVILGNTFTDCWSTSTYAVCVHVSGGNNRVTVAQNSTIRGSKTTPVIMTDGLRVAGSDNVVTDGGGNDWTAVLTDVVDAAGALRPSSPHPSSLDAFASAPVSTMPRQLVGALTGTITSGWCLAARALVQATGTYTKIRFATSTTAPAGLTDFRGGVWSSAGVAIATTANSAATVTAASTVYELSLSSPLDLIAGADVFLGIAVVGTTPGTYRGTQGLPNVGNNLPPAITKVRTGWTGGALLDLTSQSSHVLWVELIP